MGTGTFFCGHYGIVTSWTMYDLLPMDKTKCHASPEMGDSSRDGKMRVFSGKECSIVKIRRVASNITLSAEHESDDFFGLYSLVQWIFPKLHRRVDSFR